MNEQGSSTDTPPDFALDTTPLAYSAINKITYETAWQKWLKEVSWKNKEQRETAVIRLRECLDKQCPYLDLSDLNLSSLPVLPRYTTFLNAARNQLTCLPELPAGLEAFCVEDNQLKTLPKLPESLVLFNAARCQLTTLPALPKSLRYALVSSNPLAVIPTPKSPLTLIITESDHDEERRAPDFSLNRDAPASLP